MDPAADQKSQVDDETTRTEVAWQGWRLALPGRWGPVELEGNYVRGRAVFAGLRHSRLAIRWHTPGMRFEAEQWAHGALSHEVGRLSADAAKPFAKPDWTGSRLHVEIERPGRDVWVGFSPQSRRALELVCHSRRDDYVLAESVLPALRDQPTGEPMPWSIFDLACIVPAALPLERHRLTAGDLTLSFAAPRRAVTVRQVAMAELALKRMTLEQWLQQQQRMTRSRFRSLGASELASIRIGGQDVSALRGRAFRRHWCFWMRNLPAGLIAYAVYDESHDRLVFVQASEDELAREVAATVGNVPI